MNEVVAPVLKEGNARMVSIILYFIIMCGMLYLFFSVMLSCLATQTTGQCFRRFWLFYTITVIILALAYLPLLKMINQIVFNFRVTDDYISQVRRRAEIENIKSLKEMGYKIDETQFSDGIKKLIGKFNIPRKNKKK